MLQLLRRRRVLLFVLLAAPRMASVLLMGVQRWMFFG
jgi:hypothetical protein